MKESLKTLATEFADKEYAHAYLEELSNMAIAAQIQALREQRGWTQKQLAQYADMKQERICALEDVDYDAWTIKVLRRLAKAFDLTVKVSFEKFSSGILDASKISPETLKRTSRTEDLMEFSRNGHQHIETVWGKTVTTTNPSNLFSIGINNPLAGNDLQYCERRRKVA